MSTPREDTLDTFDRILGTLHGLPDVIAARPSTVTAVLPIVGRAQTYVVQTYRARDGKCTVFLQMVDAEGRARLVIPPKVADAIYRQREQLVTRSRRLTGREQWERRQRGLAGAADARARLEELRRKLGADGLSNGEHLELRELERAFEHA